MIFPIKMMRAIYVESRGKIKKSTDEIKSVLMKEIY